jgi:protein tyrosine/serine phosphatase
MSKKKPVYQLMSDYWSLLMVDHGVLRLLYRNCFRLPGGLFRSNQPDPFFLRRMVEKHKIKTIVCLRGENDQHGWFRLEREICDALQLKFLMVTIFSRGLLPPEGYREIKHLINAIELPALIHCKSGADRAGYFSVLYRHYRLGEPIESAKKELSIRFGHFKHAKTGLLDYQLSVYLENRKFRQSFNTWLADGYSKHEVEKAFKPTLFFSWLTDKLLRRE